MNTTADIKLIQDFMDWKIRKFSRSDWNDIMEILYKITKLGIFYDEKGNELFLKLWDGLSIVHIEKVYSSIIDFVKWYNEKNLTQ